MPRRKTLSEGAKHKPLEKTLLLISVGKLLCGENVLQYRYRKASVICFGDLRQDGMILCRGLVMAHADTEAHVDSGLLEYLEASTSPKYELVEHGVYRFGSFSKFATACCRYYADNEDRRENGMTAVKQNGQSIKKLAGTLAPDQQQRRKKVTVKPKKKASAKGKKEVAKKGKSEVASEYKFYKAGLDIAELREAKKALKGYRDEDLSAWTPGQLEYAEHRTVQHIKVYQKILIDLHDDAVSVMTEAEKKVYGGGKVTNSFQDVSQGQKRKCLGEALKYGDVLEAVVPKKQRLDARAKSILKQMDSVFKGSQKSTAYKPYKADNAKKVKGELAAMQVTTADGDGSDEESGLESDYSEILNEEEVVDFNDDEVDFLQNTLSHSDEEGTALSDSEMLF